MITLYDNAFSPFARKVRMVLEHKRLAFEAIDGLAADGHARLAAVNPRVEVPVLQDGDLVVINSSDIVAYLEHRYPDHTPMSNLLVTMLHRAGVPVQSVGDSTGECTEL